MKAEELVLYHTLPNGLRIVYRHCDSSVEYCGVAVNVGSRDEQCDEYGLAHFVEHTIFKGTEHRKSWHIINRMESVGGELNAYTTKEETVLYSIFPQGNLTRAVDLIADLIINSRFPSAELEKERDVVTDEINSYLDTPSEAAYDDFEDLLFKGSQLGHNILGNVDTLNNITSSTCKSYLQQFYSAPNMVFFYMGATSASKVFKTVEKYLATLSPHQPSRQRIVPPQAPRFEIKREIESHQSHTIIGARLPGLYSPQRYTIALLANILGGPGMNSMLNVSLREKRGLVYTVEASTAAFSDSGALMIYFGCDHDDVNKCNRLISGILSRLAESPLSVRSIDAAKKQYLGQLAVSSDNREQAAISTARAMLYHGEISSAQELRDKIMRITPQDILDVAQLIIPEKCSTLTLG